MDRGGIVLFTPTADELKVAPAIGDLGRIFTERGDRVLVFDARHDAENPSWAGPRAPEVARTVEGFLDGRADATSECFVPTNLNGVEYSRADLSTRVAGVMAAHRFRQLVEQMRERYSVVFLVGPPVTLDGSDPMLATLAEGMVLVTESSADLSEVHAYLDALSHQVPTRVYGTLAVPRA
jgi:Mrp family chromosome partitioning ATPase